MSEERAKGSGHPTPEEVNRLKQRSQYQQMLAGVGQLSDILPSSNSADKSKSKQIILSEAVQYIQYLKLCINQLGRETGLTDEEISNNLHWDVPCDGPCDCLQKLKDVADDCDKNNCQSYGVTIPETCGDYSSPRAKVMRRSSTPTSTMVPADTLPRVYERRNTYSRKSSGNGAKNSNGWRLSPIKSPERWFCPWLMFSRPGTVRAGQNTGRFQSPPGPECDIITPPSSYKRTIIEDSPRNISNSQHWENVSVRKSSSPWMPQPENKHESIEDVAERIVSHYGQSDLELSDDDIDGHVLSSSHPLDSFLDSSYTEDESVLFVRIENSNSRPRPIFLSPGSKEAIDRNLVRTSARGKFTSPGEVGSKAKN